MASPVTWMEHVTDAEYAVALAFPDAAQRAALRGVVRC